MRQAQILYKGIAAGTLIQQDDGCFVFSYYDQWLADHDKPSISLTLTRDRKMYKAEHLFPFFFNMLPEGSNREAICRKLRIDEHDDFGLLVHVASNDAIGAITVKKVDLST
jgi:serine/threonine-protein kinase HipA